jgi:hypothetical protein
MRILIFPQGGYWIDRTPEHVRIPNIRKLFFEEGAYTTHARAVMPSIRFVKLLSHFLHSPSSPSALCFSSSSSSFLIHILLQ